MKELITLSSKGQIVIPKAIREDAGLNSGDQLLVEWNGEQLLLRKVEKEAPKPNASVVRELLGKYRTEGQNEDTGSSNTRTFRESLYGKIDDRQ